MGLAVQVVLSTFILSSDVTSLVYLRILRFIDYIPMNDLFSTLYRLPEILLTQSVGVLFAGKTLASLAESSLFAMALLTAGFTLEECKQPQQGQDSEGTDLDIPAKLSWREAVTQSFAKYFLFTGTASRSEYWWFYVFRLVINVVLWALIIFCARSWHETALMYLYIVRIVFVVVCMLPSFSVAVRRAHDVGIICLFACVPIVSMVIMLLPSNQASLYRHATKRTPVLEFLAKLIIIIWLIYYIVFMAKNVVSIYHGDFAFEKFSWID
ncbi:MAG: DUF805 domain-containing protein [Treponema sp.]|nr:DUF805 domain-containing protein [Treponema sp.]